jgi:hypothetical protein
MEYEVARNLIETHHVDKVLDRVISDTCQPVTGMFTKAMHSMEIRVARRLFEDEDMRAVYHHLAWTSMPGDD